MSVNPGALEQCDRLKLARKSGSSGQIYQKSWRFLARKGKVNHFSMQFRYKEPFCFSLSFLFWSMDKLNIALIGLKLQ